MICLEIENLLCRKIGIDANIIGSKKIAKAVETRCSICGVNKLEDYLHILQTSTLEFDELVELIVVPETWFFRDIQPYDAVRNYVYSQGLHESHTSKLRLLSVPCSTGEEPYSLSMTLLNLGLHPHQFHIDAIDISKKALAKAMTGIYGRNSFRSNNLEFQNRYFKLIDKEYAISDQVKATVNFSQGNLLDSQFLLDRKSYDIIFCRNVLIYFDPLSRRKTLKTLINSLKTEGLILVAASETGELANLGVEIIRLDGVSVGRKRLSNTQNIFVDSSSINYHQSREQKIHPTKITTQISRQVVPINPEINHQQNVEIPHLLDSQIITKQTNDGKLETIRSLADSGDLNAAIELCERYVQADSTNPEAYVLLGEIYQARKQELQAEECYQKAIYLDPKNSDALLHLTLIKERRGDIVKANILRQRWRRLHKT
jgi:chemotaxis protein methyltransferase WspC